MKRTAEAIKHKIEQGNQELLQNGLDGTRIKNQLPGKTLPPGGNLGTGYTPGDGSVETGKLDDDAVTYAKMQNVSAASRLLGRGDSGGGDPQEITLGTGLVMAGTTLSSGSASTLDDLTDVVIASPAVADRLRYDGSVWRNSSKVWQPLTNGSISSPELIFAGGDVVMVEV